MCAGVLGILYIYICNYMYVYVCIYIYVCIIYIDLAFRCFCDFQTIYALSAGRTFGSPAYGRISSLSTALVPMKE